MGNFTYLTKDTLKLSEDFVINIERFFPSTLNLQCQPRYTARTFNILQDVRLGAHYVVKVLVGYIILKHTPDCAVLGINTPVC